VFRLTDKVVFLTCCGSVGPGWGNGKGARIFGVDINEAAARETQAIITGEGGTCEVAAGDVTDSAKVALFGWQLRRRDGSDLRQASRDCSVNQTLQNPKIVTIVPESSRRI
jgi:hypothetical protein